MILFLKLTISDVQFLVNSFRDTMAIRNNCFHFDGVIYECLRSDEGSIYAKNVG